MSESVHQTVESLKNVSATELTYLNAFYSYKQTTVTDWPWWSPVKRDGVFFTDDAQKKLQNGDFRTDINHIIGRHENLAFSKLSNFA